MKKFSCMFWSEPLNKTESFVFGPFHRRFVEKYFQITLRKLDLQFLRKVAKVVVFTAKKRLWMRIFKKRKHICICKIFNIPRHASRLKFVYLQRFCPPKLRSWLIAGMFLNSTLHRRGKDWLFRARKVCFAVPMGQSLWVKIT